MTITASEPARPASAWEVVPLGRSAFRICDRSLGHSDAARLIAYADRNELGILEVLWLRSPCPTRSRYRDLDELLADLDAAVNAQSLPRSSKSEKVERFSPAA